MLFAYKYVSHSIERMQEYIDFLFLEVWCKAEGIYSIEKLNGCPKLKEIVLAIYYNDRIQNDYLYGPIEEIFNLFKPLSSAQRERLGEWYRENNSIENLCKNTDNCKPVKYSDLEEFNYEIAIELKHIFINLFENIISLKDVQNEIGTIAEHYKAFTNENEEELCPFCGLNDLKGPYSSKREAYDHFLPKNIYPFNSINFRNLAPMCHECNSSYKLQKDPLYEKRQRDPLFSTEMNRRKAFYPYTPDTIEITISVTLLSKDIENLTPDKIELTISSFNHPEEVETWKDIFGIEERFKDKMRKKNVGKYWYIQIQNECDNYKMTPQEFLKLKKEEAEKYPWAETNFLRKPFLEACESAGLFDSPEEAPAISDNYNIPPATITYNQ